MESAENMGGLCRIEHTQAIKKEMLQSIFSNEWRYIWWC